MRYKSIHGAAHNRKEIDNYVARSCNLFGLLIETFVTDLVGDSLFVCSLRESRRPGRRIPRLHTRSVHLVHFLQGKALRFRNEEVHVEEGNDEHSTENEENERVDAIERLLDV